MGSNLFVCITFGFVAFATSVAMLVLAKGLVKIAEGSKVHDQYDRHYFYCVLMVLLLCFWVTILRINLNPWFRILILSKGRRRIIIRKYLKRFSYDWVSSKFRCGFKGYILGGGAILVLFCFISWQIKEYPLFIGKDVESVILGNKISDGCKLKVQDSLSNILSGCNFHPQRTNLFKPSFMNKENLSDTFVKKDKALSQARITMEKSNTMSVETETTTEVIKITEKLEDTNLECNALIVHHNSESSDAEEEQLDCELIGKFVVEGRIKFKVVERNLKYAWDFLNTDEDVKVFEIDQNYMIFNFGSNEDFKDYVYNNIPWSIDGNLVILHPYDSSVAYTDLDWNHQPFWIEVRDLLPEFMNQKTVINMGKIIGEVLDIEPKEGLPKSGDYFKVCVNINISTPLRRGLLCMTAAKTTKWIGFFYDKQPSKICKECYVLNHSKEDCKKASSNLATLHSQVHYFSSMRGGKKGVIPSNVKQIPQIKTHPKKSVSATRFIPPKDGVVLQDYPMKASSDTQGSGEIDSGVTLGKRQRSADHGLIVNGQSMSASGLAGSTTLRSPSTGQKPTTTSQLPTHKDSGGDKGNAKASGGHSNMEL